jgi:phosphoglycolate phosphatase
MVDMKKYKYILFDLDGTLVYSHPGIFACFRYALEKMGWPNPTDKELLPCIGPSLHYSFTTFFKMTDEQAVTAVNLYRERYEVKGVWENSPIKGALDALKTLKERGYVLGLATSKPIYFAKQIVDKHGFSAYLTESVGSGMDGSLPTKASVIEEVIKRLGAKKEECLMVGDRFHDAEGAKLMGIDCALLKIGGYADEEELYGCGAEYVFDDFSELTAFLI